MRLHPERQASLALRAISRCQLVCSDLGEVRLSVGCDRTQDVDRTIPDLSQPFRQSTYSKPYMVAFEDDDVTDRDVLVEDQLLARLWRKFRISTQLRLARST